MSPLKAIAGIALALTLLAPCSYSAEKPDLKERLIAFRDRADAIAHGKETIELTESDRRRMPKEIGDRDRMGLKALAEFDKTVKDGELEAVADFALSKEGAGIRWALADLLIDRGRFDAAAKVIAVALVADPKDRPYKLWKWWEAMFSGRKNYKELSRSFCDALLRQFDGGNAETKLAIAEAFGKGAKEAKLPLEQFREAIHYDVETREVSSHTDFVKVFRYRPGIIPDMKERNHDAEIVLARLKKMADAIEVFGGLGHNGFTVSIERRDLDKWKAMCKDLLASGTLRHFKKYGLDAQGFGFLPIDAAGAVGAGPSAMPNAPSAPPAKREEARPDMGSDGFEQVKSKGKFGFINKDGKTVVEPIYDLVRDFTFGLAAVNLGATRTSVGRGSSEGKWGYIDTKGQVIVPITLESAEPFSDGLAKVIDGKTTRFIDTHGKLVLDMGEGALCDNFSEGYCPVQEHTSGQDRHFKTRYIDHAGKTVFTVDGYGDEFREGLAAMTVLDPVNKENTRGGFIDHQGRIAIRPTYAGVQWFSEGLAAVRPENSPRNTRNDNRWGYIDVSGKYIIPPRFNEAHPFAKGLARVHEGGKYHAGCSQTPSAWEGGQWKAIDKTGADAALPFKADAEKAKAALVRLLRTDGKQFIGNPDPDEMAKIALDSFDLEKPQTFSWGAFRIDVKQRTYQVDVIRKRDDRLSDGWFHSGTFTVDASGQWTAGKPEVTESLGMHNQE